MKFTFPRIAPIAAIVALAALPAAAHAHYIWATVENGQVRFALLESVSDAPSAQFSKYVADLAPHAGPTNLTMGAVKDGARYAVLPTGQDVVLAESIVGTTTRESAPYLLIYEAKGAATLAAAAKSTNAPAEITARRDGGQLVVTVSQSGVPAPRSDVWVQWPGAAEPSSVPTDANGEVRVPYPTTPPATTSGFVGIRALVTEPQAGENAGKTYASIHRWATLTFPAATALSASASSDASEQKPFHQILRASFGNNHDVVSNSAFNQTVFADKLTKEQLIIHLQQRALIHNEVDHILSAADPALNVPYGPDQKNVLVLLRADLNSLGSVWPTEADARPLTRAFLQEIRASEKQGPFFALGVQHVYFGGITNGGRMIGAQIGETLKFTPTYYEKSDGYQAYVAQVDNITDPAARAEMIQGGQAAYRYIIASSNEAIFKAK